MRPDLLNTIILALSFLMLFGVAELLYHRFKVRAEITRKFVHIFTGLLTLLFPVLINNRWLILALCGSFAVILVASVRFNYLRSINAIDRDSVGSICYPVAVFICYLAFEYTGGNYTLYYLPILTLAICDPLAAFAGKTWPIGKVKNKTIVGSLAFFASAVAIAISTGVSIGMSLTIGLVSTVAEAVSPRGYDNITIPLSVLAVLFVK